MVVQLASRCLAMVVYVTGETAAGQAHLSGTRHAARDGFRSLIPAPLLSRSDALLALSKKVLTPTVAQFDVGAWAVNKRHSSTGLQSGHLFDVSKSPNYAVLPLMWTGPLTPGVVSVS